MRKLEVEELLSDDDSGSCSSSASNAGRGGLPEIVVRTVEAHASSSGLLGWRPAEMLLRLSALVWLLVGVVVLVWCGEEEDRMDLVTALYLIVQIITTVGYGDVTPTTGGMRLFMTTYVFVGNIITALVITERLQSMMKRSHEALETSMMDSVVESNESARSVGLPPEEQRKGGKKKHAPHKGAVIAFGTYLFFILLGVVFFGFACKCACPIGENCEADLFEPCQGGKGHTRSWIDALYMSVVTLTTVGFGDESPKSAHGRLFATVWMLLGVASMANFLAELAHVILLGNLSSMAEHGMSHELFKKIDNDQSGTLTKFEFVTYMLVKYGLVSETDLDTLLLEFEKFDKDGNGTLTYEEITPASG